MKFSLALRLRLVTLLCLVPAAAQSQPSQFDLSGSALRMRAGVESDSEGHLVVFDGKVKLAGTLLVAFDRAPGMPSDPAVSGSVIFRPDARSRLRLPRAVGAFYYGEATRIELDADLAKILQKLIGPQRASQVLNGSMPTYMMAATVTISDFRTSVECGARSFEARLIDVSASKPSVTASSESTMSSC